MGRNFGIDTEISKSNDGKYEAELGDADTGIANSIENEPVVRKPGDFGEN